MPDPYGSDLGDVETDQAKWSEFALGFKSWLFYADPKFEAELDFVEANVKTEVKLAGMSEDSRSRSLQLFSILSGLLRGRPLRILRGLVDRNGIELWRQLNLQYAPKTKGRAFSILGAYMNYPSFDKSRSLLEHIQLLERVRTEYRKASGVELADDIQLSVLVRCLPKHIQQHVQLQLKEDSSYNDVRNAVLGYENVTQNWSEKKIYTELGVVQSYGTSSGGPAPMEIDAVTWKGKGKFKGKSKDYEKGKSKGKGQWSGGYGKGKGQKGEQKGSKGKGRGDWGNHGQGQGGSGGFQGHCDYCHKYGHKKSDCYKLKKDNEKGKGKGNYVRQVEGADERGSSEVGSSPSTSYRSSSDGGSTTTAGGKPSVKLLTQATIIEDEEDYEIDLTYVGEAGGAVCTMSFDDEKVVPEADMEHTLHVRTLNKDYGKIEEIVFDSGADVSALPLRFSDVGVPGFENNNRYVDAQGNQIPISGTRLARVKFGRITFRENFILSPVTTPLICLGHLLRDGWGIKNGGGRQTLVKGNMEIPVELRGNSLVGRGRICVVQSDAKEEQHDDNNVKIEDGNVNSLVLLPALQNLAPGWNRINGDLWAMRSTVMEYQDTTLVPADTMLWFRSTLLKIGGKWELDEESHDVTLMDRRDGAVLCLDATEVLTLAHNFLPRRAGQLGYYEDDTADMIEDFVAGVPVEVPGVRAGLSHDSEAVVEHGVPAAEGEAEDPPAERDPEMDSFSVVVQGVTLDSTTPLRIIRAACKNLGLSSNGSKMKCLKRLHQHIQAQELLAQQGATASLEAEVVREALEPAVPQVPTEDQKMKHYLTHQPYAAWCEFCVANRAREDVHQSVAPSSAGSVVSFDYGYVSRLEEEKEKLTVLFIHDQHTKMMHSVPTQQKGGRSLVYLCTELVRFVLHLGHHSVILRCDDEPSTVALANASRKSLRSFGVTCKLEFVTVGNHQGNGAAEATVQVIRQLGMCFLQRMEAGGGCEKPIFGAQHPLTAWCLVHASWVHNRYATSSGQTAYEKAFDSPYQGRICQFGEVVLAYVRSSKKGAPRWLKGVWLTKTLNHDAHVIALPSAIVCTRSVRRLCNQWDLERYGSLEQAPWEFGLATLGSKLVSAKRIVEPTSLTYPVGGDMVPAEATPHDEAASDPPSPGEATLDELAEDAPQAGHSAQAGQETDEIAEVVEDVAKVAEGPPNPGLPPRYSGPSTPFPEPMELGGAAPTRDVELESSGRPSKQAKVSAPTQQIMAAMEIDHEDEPNFTQFSDEDLEHMENYDYDIEDEQMTDEFFEGDLESMLDRLSRPYSKEEPKMDDDELQELDALADLVEITRLQQQGVLIPAEQIEGSEIKTLSTKFVRTWRQKERRGAKCWLRRSRYVAREFAWLTPDREDLFSPASSAIVSRLLPYCYLKRAATLDKTQTMISLDVSDAFLTVKQETPTVVTCVDATGRKQQFGLGRVLPGQRDGALLWYRDITGLLKGKLGMEEMVACPCLLRAPRGQALLLLHVDDLLVVGDYAYIELQLLPVLKEKYKISVQTMREPGDEVNFLKRNHVLVSKTELAIYPHEKHFHKLFDLLSIKRSWKPKNVPSHTMINEVDSTAVLCPQQASVFRSAVGVLLYMASDLVECQFTIRHLARCMASPTSRAFEVLRHLVIYLLGRSEYGLLLSLEQYKYDERMRLHAYSDSDWAGHHGSRKSASSGCLVIDGILLYSSSRTQGLIALSSAEAEVYAAVSTCCDAIYMMRCLEFVFEQSVGIQLLIDNSAARQILMRSGVGRVRHLSVKILWLQQQVEKKAVNVAAVASSDNIADLGTKRLPCHTMRRLMYVVGVYDGSTRVGAQEFEEHQHKAMVKRVMRMNASTPTSSMVGQSTFQLALLSAMFPSALSLSQSPSRAAMEGQSIFLRSYITIPLWFGIVLLIVILVVIWYLVNEVRGLRQALYSWRDLCNDMESDDQEVRRQAMRRHQMSRRRLTPVNYGETEDEAQQFLHTFAEPGGIWSDRGPRVQDEVPLRFEVLRMIGQHMQLDNRESSIFFRAFAELNPGDRETMNECLVNMLYFMNSGDEELVRQSFMSMGIILQKIGARTMPLGSPSTEGEEEEDTEEDAEREEDRKQRYLHSGMEECSDTEYWISLHHHEEDPMEIDEDSEAGDGPPPDLDWERANVNQQRDNEEQVDSYRRRVVRRLNRQAEEAEVRNEHEAAENFRRQADNLYYL